MRATLLLLAARAGQLLCTQTAASLLRRDGDAEFGVEDLGPHFLVEGAEPERVYRIRLPEQSPRETPALRARRAVGGNLPLLFTRFFGREEELRRLCEQVGRERERLTTLTGPGGTGKSRLAVELGNRLAPAFPGGVWFVSLAETPSADRIPAAILGGLNARRDPARDPIGQIASLLGGQRALLIIDNYEHLLPGGSRTVHDILRQTADLQCLVTSRRPLDLEAERGFEVRPLSTPLEQQTPEELLQSDSVRLFADRAQAVRPDFQLTRGNSEAVGRLCARLEGIPLAIELAAARIQVLTPSQMLQRLEHRLDLLGSRRTDVAERHRTMRNAVEWSYRLLPPELQTFFARLSVFDGSWTAEAAEHVCEAPLALDDLAQLREFSLVDSFEGAGEMRFRMLDTIREHAREQAGPDETRRLSWRLREFFLQLAERAEPRLKSRERQVWLDRLALELPNLESALHGWESAARGRPAADQGSAGEKTVDEDARAVEPFLRLVVALSPFWQLRGYLRDGRDWFEKANACSSEGRTPLHARALDEAACLAFLQGDLAAAEPLLTRSLEVFRTCLDREGEATVLMDLGNVALVRGEFAGARRRYDEAIAIRRMRGDRQGVARCLHNFGNLAKAEGDLDAARSFLEESLRAKQEFDDPWDIASTRQSLGDVAAHCDDAESARAHYEACLAIRRDLGDRQGVAFVLGNLAMVLGAQGDLAKAEALHRESLTLKHELGDRRGISGSILNLGALALRRGDAARAVRLFAAASGIHASIGFRLPPLEQQRYDQRMAETREALKEDAFKAALAIGRLMSESEAIAYALGS